jgi:UDP-3-O-[3-hydroxymyristoyl] glucosamine N-acyltransferase
MNKKISLSLQDIAEITNCKLVGNPNHHITNVADLESASPNDASFFSNPRYLHALQNTQAGVVFIDEMLLHQEGKNYLISKDPSRAFQQLIDTFHPPRSSSSAFNGIHPTAVIHETAQLGENVSIGPHCTVDEEVKIGANTFIGAGSYVGPGTTIGESCLIHPRVVIREDSIIGNRVVIQPGAVIGSCGFGYTTDEQGNHIKLNQAGNVIIEDDVEIGANTTIDRARFKSTRIGKGSKLDNLVQIGHGVQIGPHNIIIAQTGIAGSSSTGRYVVLAGQVAVAGHLHLEDKVTVAGKSGVTKSLSTGKYGGIPAIPLHEYNRTQVHVRNIQQLITRLKDLEKKVNDITS